MHKVISKTKEETLDKNNDIIVIEKDLVFHFEYVGNGKVTIKLDGKLISPKKGENLINVLANYSSHNVPSDELMKDHLEWVAKNN